MTRTPEPPPLDPEALAAEHRDIDALLGAFFAAASTNALVTAVDSAARLDDAIRVHTSFEESLFPERLRKLVTGEGETADAREFRELRLEHVQIRELCGMLRRVMGKSGDVPAALRLAANLSTRWESHTSREEAGWLKSRR